MRTAKSATATDKALKAESRRAWWDRYRSSRDFSRIFCLSSFKLWDPELGTNDGLRYPMNRSVIFGIDVNF